MDLVRIEEQRQKLEHNLVELRQTLKHWHLLDAEYEGLKEEIQSHLTTTDTKVLERIAETYQADLIDTAEIRKLTGLANNQPHSPLEIVRVIQHRQDYVQSSIETLQRRFFDAEAKLEEFDFAASRDASTGLPLTEIHEELDDEDNIISSRVTQPESAQEQLIDSLRKAGLTDDDLSVRPPSSASLKSAMTNISPLPSPGSEITDPQRPPIRKKSVSFSADTKEAIELAHSSQDDGKKSVSFATKVAIAPAALPPDTRTVSFRTTVDEIPDVMTQASDSSNDVKSSKTAVIETADDAVQRDLRASFKPGDRVLRLDDDDRVASEHIIIPDDESEEDARLRREMLDYHLHEVGHVVAQLNLDDGYDEEEDENDDDDASSHYTSSTRYDEEDTPYTSGHSEDDDEDDYEEDEYGRSKTSVITDSYRREMLDLQARLIGNLGPNPAFQEINAAEASINAKGLSQALALLPSVNEVAPSLEHTERRSNSSKRVSFAESIDVEDVTRDAQQVLTINGYDVSDGTHSSLHATPSAPPPASILKSSPATQNPTPVPLAETNKILADSLVERTVVKPTNAPSEDNTDPVLAQRELATEYYRRRNDIIRQQGGFKRDTEDEEEFGELMEGENGRQQKVSRFKAARIKG